MMVSVFLPTRKGSERVHNKNTREFAGIDGGLLTIKLRQLLACKEITEIILSTNDLQSIDVAHSFQNNRLKIIERPEHLALSSTSLVDLVNYVPSVCSYENILWTHVTSPFVMSVDYDKIIQEFRVQIENNFDSLMTVKPIHNFLWDSERNDLINRINDEKWPRTQDLKIYYEINSAVFLSTKEIYKKYNDRIGIRPYLFEMESLKSFDIDWEEDFKIAEMLFNGING